MCFQTFFHSLIVQIKFFLEIIQVGLDLGNRFSALGGIFTEQILLAPTPNVHFCTVEFGLDDNLYRVFIDSILDNLGTRKNVFHGIAGRGEFLVPPVSVTALKMQEARKGGGEIIVRNRALQIASVPHKP